MNRIWNVRIKGEIVPIKDAKSAYDVFTSYGFKSKARIKAVCVYYGGDFGIKTSNDIILYIPWTCVIILDSDMHYRDIYVVGSTGSDMEETVYE